ncbi:MAG: hypothetical protein RQ751_10650 [Longimicrobiales bacterium]|nr:hypothetical protein [Longimicrobiales bacterium]
MIHCALITGDEALRRQVRSLVQDAEHPTTLVLEIDDSASRIPRERVAEVLAANPRVVFIDLGDSAMGLRVLEVLSQEAPETVIVAAGPSLPADGLLRMMRAGAAEYLPRPFSGDDVSQAFHRIRRRLAGARQEEPAARGQVVTVFSPKGGTGVTTLSANLAVSLSELTGKGTILLDFSPSLGTAALHLGLQARYSYVDVFQNFHRLDKELFNSFLEIHDQGVRVLASPPWSDDHAGPSMDDARALLRFCRRHYAYVVVDTGNSLTDGADAALADGDHRLLVTTPELPTLRNLKRTIERMGTPPVNGRRPPRVVVNQFEESLGVTRQEVETGLGLTVAAVLDCAPDLIPESINLGRPAVLGRRTPFARGVTALAEEIAGPDVLATPRRGLLQTLFSPFRPGVAAARGEEEK